MKKNLKVLGLIIVLFTVLFIGIKGYNDDRTLDQLSQKIRMNLTKGELISLKEEGFVDIETFVKVKYPIGELSDSLSKDEWEEYPFDASLKQDLLQIISKIYFEEMSINSGYYRIVEKDVSTLKLMVYDVNKEILYIYCIE